MTDSPENIAEDLEPLAWPIAELEPMVDNPRLGDVPALMRSLQAFGHQKPVVTWLNAEGMRVVIDGNHQVEAAKQLGWSRVPIVKADYYTEAEARGYALAANRTSDLARNDETLLKRQLGELAEIDASLVVSAGWSKEEFGDYTAGEPFYATFGDDPIELDGFDEWEHACPKCNYRW